MRSNRIAERPRDFWVVWLASLVAAPAVIYTLLATYDETAMAYPQGLPDLESGQVVFIGSSLARFALPSRIPEQGVLGDGRSCALLAVPAISQAVTTALLEHAIGAGAGTVFVEINAYAHEYTDPNEPEPLDRVVQGLRDAGHRMSAAVKSLLPNRPRRTNHRLHCGAPGNVGRHLDVERLALRDPYRFRMLQPSDPGAIEQALDRARESGVEVIFFAPPRPRAAVDAWGSEAYRDLHAHLARTATRFGVPLWATSEPWPDDHFMDLKAHAGPRGRERFREELARWYAEAP